MSVSASPPGTAAGAEDLVLAELVEEITNRLHAGERVDLEAYVAAHPEQAEQLRQLLPALHVLAALSGKGGEGAAPAAETDSVQGRLGDFRILRELGRGGMGVVYEAEQISLGRRVALKVLPFAATMDPRQLQRFHNEARAAASLHHAHIVAVHAVGCERNVHYYAMQFIEGQSLAAIIAALRDTRPSAGEEPGTAHAAVPGAASPGADTAAVADQATGPAPRDAAFYRRVAQWGIEAAEALEHAHVLGVVHRDVKPANLMIDARGKLWVTDFGLARFGTDAGLTMTGDLLGTLRYMSPEQALAKHGLVDHRTDVYSLGATLYELLSGRPAVEGQDRQELLRRIAFEEPVPPRRLNRAVPTELETVVLKALEKNPQDRYGTAQELADDLRRYLEDKPIRARRPSWSQVARKWARRQQAILSVAGLGLLVAVAVLTISSYVLWREKEQVKSTLGERDQQYQRAERQRQRAEDNFGKVLGGMTEFLEELDTNEALDPPQRAALRQALADHMEWFFQRMQDGGSTDPVVRMDTGWAYQHLGVFYTRLGDYARAEENCRKALAIHEALAAEHPEDPEITRLYGWSLDRLGTVLHFKGETSEAKPLLRRAAEQYRRLLDGDPSGRAHADLAVFLVTCVDPELRDADEAIQLATRAVEIAPNDGQRRYWLGWAHFRRGSWQAARRGVEERMTLAGEADAWDYLLLAMIHWKLGERDRAQDCYDRGVRWMNERHRNRHSYMLREIRAEAAALLGKRDEPGDEARRPPP